MKAPKTWILVADATRARFFSIPIPGRTPEPVWDHDLINANVASGSLVSDRPGRTFDRQGTGRHAKEPRTDPNRNEQRRFAREIAHKLDQERKRQDLEELIIVAPPQFLGDLRATLPTPLQRLVKAEIAKDLSKLKPTEIATHLKEII